MKKLLACLIVVLLLVGVFGIGIQSVRDVSKDSPLLDSALEHLCPRIAHADTGRGPTDPPRPPPIP